MTTANTTPATQAFNLDTAFETTAFRTKPRLLPELGKKYYFKILSAIYEAADEQIKTRGADAPQKPMHLCNVFNYADGHQYQLILNQVLEGAFTSGEGYIGKTFMVSKTKVVDGKGGKKYAAFDVVEGNIKAPAGMVVPEIDKVKPVAETAPAPAPAPATTSAPAQTAAVSPAQTAAASGVSTPSPIKAPAPTPIKAPAAPVKAASGARH